MNTLYLFGRTTPYILSKPFTRAASSALVGVNGKWSFADVGTVTEFRLCAHASADLCATIAQHCGRELQVEPIDRPGRKLQARSPWFQ